MPLPRPGEPLADTRILRSEVIHLQDASRRADIDKVETDGAGHRGFPAQPRRAAEAIDERRPHLDRVRAGKSHSVVPVDQRDRRAPTSRAGKRGRAPPPPHADAEQGAAGARSIPRPASWRGWSRRPTSATKKARARPPRIARRSNEAKDLMTLDGLGARVGSDRARPARDRLVMNQKIRRLRGRRSCGDHPHAGSDNGDRHRRCSPTTEVMQGARAAHDVDREQPEAALRRQRGRMAGRQSRGSRPHRYRPRARRSSKRTEKW